MRRCKTVALAKQFFAQGARLIVLLIDAAFLQLRDQQLHHIGESFVSDGVGKVKAIDIGLFHPALQLVGHRFGTANQQWAKATNTHPVGQRLHRPLTIRIGGGEGLHRRLDGVGVQVFKHLVRLILTKIDPGPAGDQRQRALVTDVFFVLFPLRLRRLVGFPDDHRLQVKNQDAARIAAGFRRAAANIRHGFLQQHFRWRGNKHALGMLSSKLLAPAGGSGLIQHRRALR